LFLDAAVGRLRESDAAAAFVFPASVVGGSYFQRLREVLVEEAPPRWLSFVSERDGVFPGGVLQETLLGVFVRGPRGPVACERIVFNGSADRLDLGEVELPLEPRRPWLLPRLPDDVPLIERAEASGRLLGSQGWKISTGPFVWNRHRDQLFDEYGEGLIPVVWAQDVGEQEVRPFTPRPGRWCRVREGQDWLVLDEPAILVQRTTAPEQPRRIVLGILGSDLLDRLGGVVVVENHLNVCTWNGKGELNPERLAAYLSSETADRLYRCLTGSVAVSAFELSVLPVLFEEGESRSATAALVAST